MDCLVACTSRRCTLGMELLWPTHRGPWARPPPSPQARKFATRMGKHATALVSRHTRTRSNGEPLPEVKRGLRVCTYVCVCVNV